MSRKFIQEYKNDNFVYPNNDPYEYGVEIIHDINNNSVSGLTTGFSAVLSGGNIVFSFTYQWFLNGATPFIMNNGDLSVLSVHMMEPSRTYFKPWRLIGMVSDVNPNLTYKTDTVVYTVTPQMMGVTSFTSGTYYFEIRMIGKKAVYAICAEATIEPPPTPTPTSTPTPTPTHTPTPTPTIAYDLYLADEYSCDGCTITTPDVVVALIAGTSPDYGKFYVPLAIPGFVYLLSSPTSTGPGVILTNVKYTTCNDACGYVPPPTPTPTGTPTPTPNTPTPTPTNTPTPVPPTPTPTGTPTPTPTPCIFTGSTSYGSTADDACNNPTGTVNVVGNQCLFCDCTTFTSAGFVTFADGNYVLSYGGNSLNINITGSPTTTATMYGGGCSACHTPTPTPTPPTPTPTPVPPTPTPTPVPLYGFYIWIGTSGPNGSGTCCQNALDNTGTSYLVYGTSPLSILVDGATYYADSLGDTIFAGGPGAGYYYSDSQTYGRINNSGLYTQDSYCAF